MSFYLFISKVIHLVKTKVLCFGLFQTFANSAASANYDPPSPRYKLSCSVCGKPFRFRSALLRHMKSHTGEKPYACNICGTSCARADHLYLHRRTMHPECNMYQCICGQDFAECHDLFRHKRQCAQEDGSNIEG